LSLHFYSFKNIVYFNPRVHLIFQSSYPELPAGVNYENFEIERFMNVVVLHLFHLCIWND